MYQRKSIFSVFILLALSLTLFFSSNIQAATSAYSRIEAESFSSQSGIQIETCSDTGAGQDIGYIQNGDYVVFSGIDFGSGAAGFSARVTSANSGGNVEIHLDSLSGALIGTCAVPGTGGWQSWVTQTCTVSGASGVHDVFLKFSGGSQDLMNLNWFQFLALPKVSAYVQIEAENFTGQSGIQTESCSDTGAGQDIGYIVNGDYTVYSNIDFGSGATSFSARVASANSGGNIEIHLDSLSGALVGTCVAPGTGGWQSWVTQTCTISGASGVHDVYLKYVGSTQDLMNVNWFRFASSGVSAFSPIQAENFSSQSEIQTQACSDTGGGTNIGYIENGDYAVYAGIDFGSGAAGFAARVASANTSGGSIEIHLDSLSGTLVGTCAVPATGGWQTWVTDTCSVSGASGVHDVYLKFTGGSNGLMNVNWFQFTTTVIPVTPDFGPNVIIFDPTMSAAAIQSQCDAVFIQQESNQFGSNRYALLFKPGAYSVDVNVGFYTEVLGLGQSPDEVNITGAVHSEADWMGGNATCNFWRSCGNLAVTPLTGANRWAVSQAAPFRRMHIRGNLVLDDGGWSSGGFISDSQIDGQVNSGSQQQWFSRNTQLGSWTGSNWNMVFVGVNNAPADSWPSPPYTVVNQTPLVREKPFLYIDQAGNYNVFVPALRTDSRGNSWSSGTTAGESLPIGDFYIAKSATDTAASMNAALVQGKNLLLTPGIYHLNDTIRVTRANTVVLGLGLATLKPDTGLAAMTVADVDGVKVAGIFFDAGEINSPVLLEVGPANSLDHSANPTSLHDLFFRVGGAGVGKATVSLRINSNNVIGDHFWIWRADHGDAGVGWNTNTAANGLVVNGNNVTIYGLFVEHYQQYQTIWNGNNGQTYFYQSEIPYDVPNQAGWMNNGVNGFASYKVADGVTNHETWGLGIYSYFSTNHSVKLAGAIEAPYNSNVKFHHLITYCLGGYGEITHIIDNTGSAVNSGNSKAVLTQYP